MTVFRKKSTQLAMTLVLVAGIILAGTFAWLSFTQNATNVLEGFTNPKVNLHDDFWEPNKDVYVENSGNQPLYVRVRLDEWMDINGTTVQSRQGQTPFEGVDGTQGWLTHTYLANSFENCGEEFHDYYQWVMGNKDNPALDPDLAHKYYLPAPFVTQALFKPDGTQAKAPGVVTNALDETGKPSTVKYGMAEAYTDADLVLMDEAYAKLAEALEKEYAPADGDTPAVTAGEHLDALYAAVDTADEAGKPAAQAALNAFLQDPANGLGYWDKVNEINASGDPIADQFQIVWVPIERTLTTEKIYTMAEWITAGSPTGSFWIIDNDGWCYWGNVLMPNQATGLLLSEVNIKDNKPSKWTYKINAKLQAVTFDDIAKFADTSENGGGGITDQGSMVLQAVSGGYAFDWASGATENTDPVYTFKSYGNNVYAKVTTDGTNVTYGSRFIYTGPVPAANRGDLDAGDTGYKNGKIIIKDATGLIDNGAANTQFTVAADTLVQGDNGDWYLKLSYTDQPDTTDVYLAVGANRQFDPLKTDGSADPAVNDDILIWVDKDAKPGSGNDRKQETAEAKRGHQIGDEITIDDTAFQVIGMTNADGNPASSTLIIAKNVTMGDDGSGIASSVVQEKLNAQLNALDSLKDKSLTAKLLTVQDAMDYFAANADRAATDADGANQTWWLDGGIVGASGELKSTGESDTAGVRLALWIGTEELQGILDAAAASVSP